LIFEKLHAEPPVLTFFVRTGIKEIAGAAKLSFF
jgi:hypothetical protein